VEGDGEVRSVRVGRGAAEVAAGPGGAWVADTVAGTLRAVDAQSLRVGAPIRVGGMPRALLVADGTVWAAVDGGAPGASGGSVAGIRPLPTPPCEPVIAGGDGADVLLVSDLPLQGGVRITATQMAQAITFVLRERGFRAGRFRVAYQSCDDSIARTGLYDEAKCAANARAYGARREVVAVIGTLNSPCAEAALPYLNRAPGGPVPMVSPLNSFVGLTRPVPDRPGLPDAFYPTGRRSYLRVFPTDDLQGAALAMLARERGRRAVFVLDDGEPGYGELMADGFATAAGRLGLRVAGRAHWDPRARGYRALARRVAASGVAAVFLGGLIDTNAAQVIRDLRAALGPDADLMGPDGLAPLGLLEKQAGVAARGVLISYAGIVMEGLPPAGEAFAERFAAAQPGLPVEPAAIYAAQATQVVLDALARSDGTRASLLEALFATRVEDGLLGDFAFTPAGDITESPVTVLRVARGGGSRQVRSIEGGVVERVLRPPARLVE
jgi:branched-chain amino acid transport system substrate-binding protein